MTRLFLTLLFVCLLTLSACDDDSSADNPSDDDSADDDSGGDDDSTYDPYATFSPVGKPIGEMLGISSHMSRGAEPSPKRDMEIEALVESGIKMVRTDFKWDIMEAQDDVWYFDGYDTMVGLCLDAGLSMTAILGFDVLWAAPDHIDDLIDPALYGDFSAHVAAHFADRIDYYEIWNEQNIPRFWQPLPNPQKFGEMMKAGYPAIHDNDPVATVIFGGLSPLNRQLLEPAGIWSFLVQVYDAHPDICDWFDAMSIHPYTFFQQTSPERSVDLSIFRYPTLVESIDQIRGILAVIGCPDKPIHLTEMGWPDLFIGRDRQGAFLARGVMLAASRLIDYFDWYTFWDGSGDAELPTEDAFGLYTWYDYDPQPKPSFFTAKALSTLLGDSRFAGNLAGALSWPEEERALAFVDESGTYTIGLWHTDPDLTTEIPVSIPLPPNVKGQWTLYSQTGDFIAEGDTGGGAVELVLLGWVHYLKFETDADAE